MLRNRNGRSLIEYAVIFIFASVGCITVFNIYVAITSSSSLSWGINGVMEMRCVNGMQFTVDQSGNARQVIDEFGKGLRCN